MKIKVTNYAGDSMEVDELGGVSRLRYESISAGKRIGDYKLEAECTNPDHCFAVIAYAENEGSEVRKRVEDLIRRTIGLWDEIAEASS